MLKEIEAADAVSEQYVCVISLFRYGAVMELPAVIRDKKRNPEERQNRLLLLFAVIVGRKIDISRKGKNEPCSFYHCCVYYVAQSVHLLSNCCHPRRTDVLCSRRRETQLKAPTDCTTTHT
jgi:hypothetical protein